MLAALLRFVPVSDEAEGVEVLWEKGDVTLIQVDHASITPEHSHMEVMSLYRFLVLLERVKRISAYKLTYTDCKRKDSGGSDGFQVTIAEPHKYKTMAAGEGRAVTCKNFFATHLQGLKSNSVLLTLFRWRFERVHACCKIQKPYVVLSRAIEVKAGKPVECA